VAGGASDTERVVVANQSRKSVNALIATEPVVVFVEVAATVAVGLRPPVAANQLE